MTIDLATLKAEAEAAGGHFVSQELWDAIVLEKAKLNEKSERLTAELAELLWKWDRTNAELARSQTAIALENAVLACLENKSADFAKAFGDWTWCQPPKKRLLAAIAASRAARAERDGKHWPDCAMNHGGTECGKDGAI